MTINKPVLVNNNAIPSSSPIPDIKYQPNYSDNIKKIVLFLKILFNYFFILITFHLYQ